MILVLDDNIDDLEFIARHFKKNGITDFEVFTDTEPFLKAVNNDVITVVLDHEIGNGKTGFDVMDLVMDLNPVCFIIILSGNLNPHIIIEYSNHDAFRYVSKNDSDYLDQLIFYVRQAEDRINRIIHHLTKNGK